MSNTAYDFDLYAWTQEQASALRRKAHNEIDWGNLAEEIEAVGGSQRREIRSRLVVLLVHLLKWEYQPDWRCNSWRRSIRDARREIDSVLEDNPSLRSLPGEALAKAFANARPIALEETGLLKLPEVCQWSIDEVLDDEWLP
jgi:Domain of unknown function DUF29